MRPTITMEIRRETYEELLTLADTLGYPPEAAMSYAVRWSTPVSAKVC